ncbi:hypothetical protein IFM89_017385 [Coptis chinensis]|uniref:Dehydrogenase E1 component domain-containing protein n=1 Tax=Coptis chinensis TaxID=261450 RepID=A0A835HKU2_9MAGN|nr:hypothetical protein IFM89_017385 [Coptis chinensis]
MADVETITKAAFVEIQGRMIEDIGKLKQVDGMDALAVKQACKFVKEYAMSNGPIVVNKNKQTNGPTKRKEQAPAGSIKRLWVCLLVDSRTPISEQGSSSTSERREQGSSSTSKRRLRIREVIDCTVQNTLAAELCVT